MKVFTSAEVRPAEQQEYGGGLCATVFQPRHAVRYLVQQGLCILEFAVWQEGIYP